MIHNYLSSYDKHTGAHWSVGTSSTSKSVLVQLQDERGEQVRVSMTPKEARDMLNLLTEKISELKPKRKIPKIELTKDHTYKMRDGSLGVFVHLGQQGDAIFHPVGEPSFQDVYYFTDGWRNHVVKEVNAKRK